MIFKLIPFKLKGFIALSSVATCGASVAVSGNTISSDVGDCVKETVNTATTQITSIADQVYSTYLKGSYDKFQEKYESVKDKAKNTFTKDNAKQIPDKYKEWGQASYEFAKSKFSSYGDAGDQGSNDNGIRQKLETINYYAFEYAQVVKAVLEKIGPLLNGTIRTVAKNTSTAGNISVQKIQEIYGSDQLGGIAAGFMTSYSTHADNFQKIKGEDLGDAIKILFTPESGQMNTLLTKVQTNIMQLSGKNKDDFKDPKDLVKFIFMGDNVDQTIQQGATAAKSTVSDETTKGLLTTLLGEGAETTLQDLDKVLEQLSTSTQPQEQA